MSSLKLTQVKLKEMLSYNPETGVFTWIVDRGGKVKTGSEFCFHINHGSERAEGG